VESNRAVFGTSRRGHVRMTLSIDEKLHSEAPTVVIEAAAGYGKTTKAAAYACEAAERLDSGRVLLLSHTHAACGEFHRKCKSESGRKKVDVETCDSFCLKVIGTYAAPLGLPIPLDARLGRADNCVPFAELSKKACQLLKRAPTVAKVIARHYPIIILDEHQDASLSQHESVNLLREIGGARLRFFGDPMQAIHVNNAGDYVDFNRLWSESAERDRLETPHRWSEAPDLGEWIGECRSRLRVGDPILLRDAPQSVQIHLETNLAGRKRYIDAKRASWLIHSFLSDSSASAALLIWNDPSST